MNPEKTNSVVGEPTRGAGDYDFAKNTSLDANSPVSGGAPTMDSGFGQEGSIRPSLSANVDIKNSDTNLNIGASQENLSAKYKYPNVSQDRVSEDKTATPGASI
jgi:hypothetical protein